jgi:chromosome segregation ATPase
LEELENNYFSYKLNEIETSRSKINPILKSLETQIGDKEKELKILESEIKKIESQPKEGYQEIKKIKNQQSKLLLERSQIQKELGRLEAKLEILVVSQKAHGRVFKNEDLLGLINETRESLEKCLVQSNFEIIRALIKKIDDFLSFGDNNVQKSQELSELNNLKNNLEIKFNTLEKELRKLEEQETKFTTDLEKFNKNFQETFESVEAKRKELRDLKEEKNKVFFRRRN